MVAYLDIKYQNCKYSIVVYIQISRHLPTFNNGSHDFSKHSVLHQSSQMGLTALTRAQLVFEGVANADDLSDREDDDWYQFYSNYRRLVQIFDANNNLINQDSFIIPVRSLKRL